MGASECHLKQKPIREGAECSPGPFHVEEGDDVDKDGCLVEGRRTAGVGP